MQTLEEVVLAFELWRSKRSNKSESIPEALWALAKGLVPHYKKTQIQKALRLSGSQFNRYCLSKEGLVRTPSSKAGFAVGTLMPIACSSVEEFALTVKGSHKSLEIKVTMQHLASVLSLVEQYL